MAHSFIGYFDFIINQGSFLYTPCCPQSLLGLAFIRPFQITNGFPRHLLTHSPVLFRLKCAKLTNKLAFLKGEECIFLTRLQKLIVLLNALSSDISLSRRERGAMRAAYGRRVKRDFTFKVVHAHRAARMVSPLRRAGSICLMSFAIRTTN
jgi:hypothetical protein